MRVMHHDVQCDSKCCQAQCKPCDCHVIHSPAGEGMYCMYAGRTIGLGLGGKYCAIFISLPESEQREREKGRERGGEG